MLEDAERLKLLAFGVLHSRLLSHIEAG